MGKNKAQKGLSEMLEISGLSSKEHSVLDKLGKAKA